MVIWINGAFGSGKTSTAFELNRRLPNSFVYDPENIGFFIRKNSPKEFSDGDFQDIPLWREMNYRLISLILSRYTGILIVPMTIVKPEYYSELIGRLTEDGVDVRHFILYASKKELLHRLRFRISSIFCRDTFAKKSIDRCIYAFDNFITEERINTDDMSIDDVVNEIARQCEITLSPDKRTKLGRSLFRTIVLLRHIR